MRIVYDDTMQDEMVTAVEKFMASLDVKIVIRYERRMGSVQMNILREKLNLYL